MSTSFHGLLFDFMIYLCVTKSACLVLFNLAELVGIGTLIHLDWLCCEIIVMDVQTHLSVS